MTAEMNLNELGFEALTGKVPVEQTVGVWQYGPSVYAKSSTYRGRDFLVVLKDYRNGLKTHMDVIDGDELRLLVADRSMVESDVREGAFGDFLTEALLYPHRAVANTDYVERLALDANLRILKEEARSLVLSHGELCRGLVAKVEYFGLSRMKKRARSFIPSLDMYFRFLDASVRAQNIRSLRSAMKAAASACESEILTLEDDSVVISDDCIDLLLKDRTSAQVRDTIEHGQRTFYSYYARGRSIYPNLELILRELYNPLRLTFSPQLLAGDEEDLKSYLYLKTGSGLISMNETRSLEEIASKLRPGSPVVISPLAGLLNEVFLVTLGRDRYVAKKFTDWHGFKWFSLNLVSFGSKSFAMTCRARLSNEYGMNRYLASRGLNVPEIVYLSLKQRLLIQRFVSGTPLSESMSVAVNQNKLDRVQVKLFEDLGEALGKIHRVGVSVGDSKPENFIANANGIFLVDLEQASKRDEFAWDIAELLFYAGHYSNSGKVQGGLNQLTEAFKRGYLKEGRSADLRKAGGARFTKVFSIWTAPTVLLETSKALKKAA